MPDNFPLNTGSGRLAATDEVSYSGDTADVQLVRWVDVSGTEGGKQVLNLLRYEDQAHVSGDPGLVTFGVRRDVISSGTALVQDGDYVPLIVDQEGRQWVRPAPVQLKVKVTPVISTGTAYTSGDILGGTGSASQPIKNAVRISGGSGLLQGIVVLDKTQAQRAAMDILFFDRQVAVQADNAAAAITDAEMENCLGIVPIGPYNTVWPGTPLNSISTIVNIGLPFVLNGVDLHFVVVVRGTPTYTSISDLIFTFIILQD